MTLLQFRVRVRVKVRGGHNVRLLQFDYTHWGRRSLVRRVRVSVRVMCTIVPIGGVEVILEGRPSSGARWTEGGP